LIPLVLRAASGRSEAVTVFGTDHDTPDGTCIRDYVHVNDLCDAHMLAMQSLWNGAGSAVFNLGNGNGFSVLDVTGAATTVDVLEEPRVARGPVHRVEEFECRPRTRPSALMRSRAGHPPRAD